MRKINQPKKLNRKRKTETRLKILAGAVVLREASQSDLMALADKMVEKDKKWFLNDLKKRIS